MEKSEQSLTGYSRIVAAEAFQFAAKIRPAKCIEQILNTRQSQILLPDDQVVALAYQRNERQPENPRGGSGSEATIHRARLHLPRRGEMAGREIVVTADAAWSDPHPFQARIQQSAAACSFLPVYD